MRIALRSNVNESVITNMCSMSTTSGRGQMTVSVDREWVKLQRRQYKNCNFQARNIRLNEHRFIQKSILFTNRAHQGIFGNGYYWAFGKKYPVSSSAKTLSHDSHDLLFSLSHAAISRKALAGLIPNIIDKVRHALNLSYDEWNIKYLSFYDWYLARYFVIIRIHSYHLLRPNGLPWVLIVLVIIIWFLTLVI